MPHRDPITVGVQQPLLVEERPGRDAFHDAVHGTVARIVEGLHLDVNGLADRAGGRAPIGRVVVLRPEHVARPRLDTGFVGATRAAIDHIVELAILGFNGTNKIVSFSRVSGSTSASHCANTGMPANGHYQHLIDWFTEEGIELSRLDFQPRASLCEYFYLHHHPPARVQVQLAS